MKFTIGIILLTTAALMTQNFGLISAQELKTVSGTVSDAHTGDPIEGAAVQVDGVDPVGSGWSQSYVRYYVFGLLFVIFDVEAVFIFPWAIKLEELGMFGLIEMLIFISILVLGLIYAIRKGVLEWE